jgi:hypothetical protein
MAVMEEVELSDDRLRIVHRGDRRDAWAGGLLGKDLR